MHRINIAPPDLQPHGAHSGVPETGQRADRENLAELPREQRAWPSRVFYEIITGLLEYDTEIAHSRECQAMRAFMQTR